MYIRSMMNKVTAYACDRYIAAIKQKAKDMGENADELISYQQQLKMPSSYRSQPKNIDKYRGKSKGAELEMNIGLLAWYKKENDDSLTFVQHVCKANKQLYADNDQYVQQFDYLYIYEEITDISIDFGVVEEFKHEIPTKTDDNDDKELHYATQQGYVVLAWKRGHAFKTTDIKAATKYDGRIKLEGIINVY